MRKIAIANRKGGVGKSTTAVSLAHGLAEAGKRALLVDTDQQGHCALLLGVDPEHGLADLFEGADPGDAIMEARPGLFLLAGSLGLTAVDREISRRMSRVEYALGDVLRPFENQFDVVLLDTAPGMSYLSVNSLFYADEILVPCSMEVLAVEGALRFQKELEDLVAGKPFQVVPTFVDGRVSRTEKILESLVSIFGERVTYPVRYSTRLAESPAAGQTIFEYRRKEKVADDYRRLVGVLL